MTVADQVRNDIGFLAIFRMRVGVSDEIEGESIMPFSLIESIVEEN